MAFTPCSSLAGNIASDCTNPRIKGYESIGLIFRKSAVKSLIIDAVNPRIIKSITFPEAPTKSVGIIYNPRQSPAPFNGTKTEFQLESNQFKKTVQFYYEGIGGTNSFNVVEPLKNINDYVIILERKDKRGDGSYQVFGWESGLTATAQVYDEETGYWLITMECEEPHSELTLFDTDYATTKAQFEAFKALCY